VLTYWLSLNTQTGHIFVLHSVIFVSLWLPTQIATQTELILPYWKLNVINRSTMKVTRKLCTRNTVQKTSQLQSQRKMFSSPS